MIYIFKRNKKSGKKTIIQYVDSEDEARSFCQENNVSNSPYWYEWTKDKDYVR